MKRTMKNILVVDSDLGFILWLGRVLIGAHQQLLPACSVSDAMLLVGEPAEPVDLLIINSSMPHSSELIDRLRGTQSHMKVLALGEEGKRNLPHIHTWRRKPVHPGHVAEQKWLQTVQSLLAKRKPAGVVRNSQRIRAAS